MGESDTASQLEREVIEVSEAGGHPGKAVTLKAVITALTVVTFGILWTEWSSYYFDGSQVTRSYFPMALFFPFLTVAILSVLANRWRPGAGLSRGELLVVLGMGLVGMTIPYDGIMKYLIQTLAVPYYFASPENGWELYLHDHIPTWLVPQNTHGAMVSFVEGRAKGSFPSIGVWVTPLFWWAWFLAALAFASFCMVVALRKPWVEYERLTYPLLEVGQMLTETEREGRLPQFLKDPVFWIGFGLVMGIKMWNLFSYFSPRMPPIPLKIGSIQVVPDFPLMFRDINFYAIGFGYFARLDVLSSVWIFVLATAFEVFAFNRFGYPLGAAHAQWSSRALGWQSLGALLFLAGWSMWMARRHLGEVCRKAIDPRCEIDDSDELLAYRTVVLGFGVAILFAGGWLYAAGMALWLTPLFLLTALLTFLGLSRVVAELGLAFVYYQVQPHEVVLHAFGSRMLSSSSITSLAFMEVIKTTGKGFVMPAFAQAVRVARGVIAPRRITRMLWFALGFAFVVSLSNNLFIGYELGLYNMEVRGSVNQRTFNGAVSSIRNPTSMGGDGRVMWLVVGAAAMALLTQVRYQVPWWPVHPIGLAIQGHIGVTRPAFSIFLIWMVKLLIVNLGGVKLYERGKPVFVGILAGQALSTAIVFIADLIWFPLKGHNVHNF